MAFNPLVIAEERAASQPTDLEPDIVTLESICGDYDAGLLRQAESKNKSLNPLVWIGPAYAVKLLTYVELVHPSSNSPSYYANPIAETIDEIIAIGDRRLARPFNLVRSPVHRLTKSASPKLFGIFVPRIGASATQCSKK